MPLPSLREYEFLETTVSLCSTCKKRADGKIIQKDDKIYVLKYCLEHGEQEEILEEDAAYYRHRMEYNKPGNVCKTQTVWKKGCPFDCGLCPSHEQHTCIGLIEVTDKCNMACPTCYANSGVGDFLPVETIDRMLDFFLETENGVADILQISGGEPTIHPDILEIVKLAQSKGIKYVLLNTNGLRLATDEPFVAELAKLNKGFEIYMQFDGFDPNTYKRLRGGQFLEVKKRAIENLQKHGIPLTLVGTIERGVNDHEIGHIIEYGLNTPGVRGINFQPVTYFGRYPHDVNIKDRITLTGILNKIEEQTSGLLLKKDFIPLPCNVDRVALSYLYRSPNKSYMPIFRDMDVRGMLPAIRNTFKFDPDDFFADFKESLKKDQESCCGLTELFTAVKRFIPKSYWIWPEEKKRVFLTENTFRISISSFIDVYNFDLKSMQKECVHTITPDLKKIPFSAYNMLHRPQRSSHLMKGKVS